MQIKFVEERGWRKMMTVDEAITHGHYCLDLHTKIYKDKIVDYNGEVSVSFSYKKRDGRGFCVEKIMKGNKC